MRMMRPKEVAERLGIAVSTLKLWYRTGEFPRPQKIGPRAVGWSSEEVEQWLVSRPLAGKEQP